MTSVFMYIYMTYKIPVHSKNNRMWMPTTLNDILVNESHVCRIVLKR